MTQHRKVDQEKTAASLRSQVIELSLNLEALRDKCDVVMKQSSIKEEEFKGEKEKFEDCIQEVLLREKREKEKKVL